MGRVQPPPHARKPPPAIQAAFLNRQLGQRVSVLLFRGERVVGALRGFDTFTLESDSGAGGTAIVYKHGVLAIMPNGGAPRR